MKYLYQSNSWISKLGNKLVNYALLNMVFLLTSLPIITVGVSLTSLFSVSYKMIDENADTGLVKLYFKVWKENFKRGMVFGVIQIALTVLLWVLGSILGLLPTVSYIIGGIGLLVGIIFYGVTFVYLYGYTARYEDTVWNSLKVSLQMGLIKWQQSAALLVTLFACGAVFTSNATFLALGLMLFSTIGCAALVHAAANVEIDVFDQFQSRDSIT